MLKQIGVSQTFDSIVYKRTCDVIATPMCNCLCTYWPRRTSAAAPHCILKFGFGFGVNDDYHGAQYG